jgi:hypothetical protein
MQKLSIVTLLLVVAVSVSSLSPHVGLADEPDESDKWLPIQPLLGELQGEGTGAVDGD